MNWQRAGPSTGCFRNSHTRAVLLRGVFFLLTGGLFVARLQLKLSVGLGAAVSSTAAGHKHAANETTFTVLIGVALRRDLFRLSPKGGGGEGKKVSWRNGRS